MATSDSGMLAPTVAPYPFNLSSADIILRTPDLTEFQVQTFLLSIASPIFRDMLSLPQSQASDQSCQIARPVVDVTEDSRTLESLLRLCYPAAKPTFDVLEDIVLVFKAAIKYDMEWAIPPLMKDLKLVIPQNPLRAWAVACRSASEDVAREAASAVLATLRSRQKERTSSLHPSPIPLPTLLREMLREHGDEVLDGICAGDLFRLRQFIASANSKPSFMLLTSPRPATPDDQGVALSPAAAVLQLGLPDVLLQCCDGTQHPAHSFVLAFHSPVLGKEIEAITATTPVSSSDTIGTLPNPTQSLPVISLSSTNSETLAILLGLCYGTTSPPARLPLLAAALVASKTYAMFQVEKPIMECWEKSAKVCPLEAYFVAIQHGLETCARAAAIVVLEHPITTSYVEVMESSSALAYRRILDYYSSCTDVIGNRLTALTKQWNTAVTSVDYWARQRISREPYNFMVRHRGSVETYLSDLVRSVEDQGPSSNLGVDASGLLKRFCSSTSSPTETLWPLAWERAGHCIVDILLKISELPQSIRTAIDEVELEI